MVWPGYPEPATLKAEIDAMVAALRTVLERHGHNPAGMYAKGSAFKQWDSPIDYVPDLSDVDIHVRMDSALVKDIDEAMLLSAEIEAEFRLQVPSPIHVPILQVSFLHELEREEGYHPSPPGTTYHLHGVPYAAADMELAAAQERAITQLLENKKFLDGKLKRMFYKEGWSLPRLLRDIAWRISSTGPHVLTLQGMPYAEAWSLNRTQVVAALRKAGEREFADSYERFYLCAWGVFRGEDCAREGIIAGWSALSRSVAIAEARRNT